MLNKLTPQTDTQFSEEKVANIVLKEALAQIAALTNLPKQQCAHLLHEQLKMNHLNERKTTSLRSTQPIINQNESNFIFEMFNKIQAT